jgi:peptidoglycan hydrolase-like protein with peptidoglycan-binding domain
MAGWPLERTGSTGEDVRTVQYLLDAHGSTLSVDGDFGPLTNAAVESFQGTHGLSVDGIVGNQTWPALIIQVSQGMTGDAVKAAQSQINSRTGYLAVDGIFGPATDGAVRSFQGALGLTVDGIVGPITWNHLVNGYLASTDAASAAQGMFQSWTQNDQVTAAKYATQNAVAALFSHTWSPSAGWTFSGSSGAAGHVGVEWTGGPGTLVLLANDNAGTPFFFVDAVDYP